VWELMAKSCHHTLCTRQCRLVSAPWRVTQLSSERITKRHQCHEVRQPEVTIAHAEAKAANMVRDIICHYASSNDLAACSNPGRCHAPMKLSVKLMEAQSCDIRHWMFPAHLSAQASRIARSTCSRLSRGGRAPSSLILRLRTQKLGDALPPRE